MRIFFLFAFLSSVLFSFSQKTQKELIHSGITKAKLGDFQAAILAMEPEHAEAYANRGVARQYLNDLAGACEDWNKADSLGSEKARKYLYEFCEP
ncbi:MAG: hypothetical protein V1733_11450 [bacterium]